MTLAEKRKFIRLLKRNGVRLTFGAPAGPVTYTIAKRREAEPLPIAWEHMVACITRDEWRESTTVYRFDWIMAQRMGVTVPARDALRELGALVINEEIDTTKECSYFEVASPIPHIPLYLDLI